MYALTNIGREQSMTGTLVHFVDVPFIPILRKEAEWDSEKKHSCG